jgi:hypothetical protein
MRELMLVPFSFWLRHDGSRAEAESGQPPVLAGLQQAMVEQLAALGHPDAEPLRWAITGVDPNRGLRLEGIGLSRVADRSVLAAAAAATGDPRPTDAGIGSFDAQG